MRAGHGGQCEGDAENDFMTTSIGLSDVGRRAGSQSRSLRRIKNWQ